MERSALILNSNSSRSEQFEPVRHQLASEFDVHEPCSRDECVRLAQRLADCGAPSLVAAGGDGTINAVLAGIHASDKRPVLGVLPLGTGNDLARTLAVPLDINACAELLMSEPEERAFDLISVEHQSQSIGINVLNIGVARAIADVSDEDLKSQLGPFAYVVGGAKAVAASWRIRLVVDDAAPQSFEIAALAICSGRTAGGGFQLAPTADPEDGLLDVLVVPASGLPTLTKVAAKARAGALVEDPDIHRLVGRDIRIELLSDNPVGATLDGEALELGNSLHVRLLQRAQPVWVGPAYTRSVLEN